MNYYEGLKLSLEQALADAKGETKLRKTKVTIYPVKEFKAEEIKKIRLMNHMSQTVFAGYMGVSNKTIEAWESGTKKPSGIARRMLTMLEIDPSLTKKYPFVTTL